MTITIASYTKFPAGFWIIWIGVLRYRFGYVSNTFEFEAQIMREAAEISYSELWSLLHVSRLRIYAKRNWGLYQIDFNDSLQEYYDTYDEAYKAARNGKIWGFIYFADNFTESLQDVRDNVRDADAGSFHTSEIKVYLDKSDQQVTFFLEKKLIDTYKEFAEGVMTDCHLPKQLANIPIKFEDPLYGTFNDQFTDFMAPGVVMTYVLKNVRN